MEKVNRGHLSGLQLAIKQVRTIFSYSIDVAELESFLECLIDEAAAAPEQEAVAEVRYMGYEPANHLNWLGKNSLQLLPDGAKLYTQADMYEMNTDRLRADAAVVAANEAERKLAEAQVLLREMDNYLSRRGDGESIHSGSKFHMALGDFLSATAQPADGVNSDEAAE